MIERPFPILDKTGRLAEKATAICQATCWYPNDVKSRADYLEYLLAAQKRMLRERELYEPSAFLTSVETMLAKGQGKRAVAGIVFIYLYRLVEAGDSRPRLRDAARLTEALIEKRKKEHGPNPLSLPWRKGTQTTIKQERIVSSINNIETRFHEFSSVASFMAARLSVRVPERDTWDYAAANEELEVYLEIASKIEDVVFDAVPELFPNPWSVRATKTTFTPRIESGWNLSEYPLVDH